MAGWQVYAGENVVILLHIFREYYLTQIELNFENYVVTRGFTFFVMAIKN